jgi:phosphoglycolate phosphatase-like HAD superfamily hydrolase
MLGPLTDIRRLILWDIDGTLMTAGASARTAFDDAVAQVIGREPGEHGVQMSGKTDPQIALEILATLALTESEAREHLPGVLQALEERLEDAIHLMRADGRVLPGVEAALAALGQDPHVLQTVLTGNLAANARVKLAVFGLDRWLDLRVGAYGSDHPDRMELVPVALEKVLRTYGANLDPDDVWVVGETPLDLACAVASGAHCLLVATGRFALDELRTLDADVVLPDLSDTRRVLGILTGARASK